MNRERMSSIAHAGHPIRSPLGDNAVRRLLERGLSTDADRVLDLGSGSGEWLLRALNARPEVRAVGVDVAGDALAQAADAARASGVQDRLVLHQQKAADFTDPEPFDVILSFGASHAFGGLLPTLAAARKLLAPGGRVLVGDGFWQHPPTPEAVEMLGEFDDLATATERRAEWLHVYRDTWGFVSLVLRRAD